MKEDSRLIITRYNGKILSLLLKGNRLIKAQADTEAEGNILVGEIYIGRVRNVVQNIRAAFVDIGEGRLCFLPLDKVVNPVITNRVYDGRIVAGDEIVIQITREAFKTKEAACETQLSFPGQYAVVTTGKETGIKTGIKSRKFGFSGKLTPAKKQELNAFLKETFPEFPYDLIIRTNAGGLSDYEELKQEILTLKAEADELIKRAYSRTCFTKLKEVLPMWITVLRDMYHDNYDKIVTDDILLYEQLSVYCKEELPAGFEKLSFYDDTEFSLFKLYGLESKLKEVLTKNVWLPSGGYLVIEPTEALTVIDVNSGKYSGKKAVEDTFYLINKEACAEIARQLSLRNLSGIILVDFINMESSERKQELLTLLQELVRKDSVRTNVIDMTPLGLVEITRKKVHKTLAEQMA